ncbi:MAG: hypothetical protein ABF856_17055, partial [Acetobacter aceti]
GSGLEEPKAGGRSLPCGSLWVAAIRYSSVAGSGPEDMEAGGRSLPCGSLWVAAIRYSSVAATRASWLLPNVAGHLTL